MSILNVNQIQPVGSGQTITVSATNIDTGSATVTAGTFSGGVTATSGNLTGITSVSTTNLTVNGSAYPTAGPLSNRNLIINGAMNIWQRNDTYDEILVWNDNNENYQSIDRFAFRFGNSADGSVSIAKTTDVPSNQGFSNAYKVGVNTTITPTTNMIIYPEYVIEAQDIRNSGWNYNDSNSFITVSFWTKSNKTGTYNLGAFTDDGTRQFFSKEYTINSSDTWEYKEISIPGYADIEFKDDNGIGLRIDWHLSIGPDRNDGTSGSWSSDATNFSTPNQVNFMDNTANEWYLTGVQLESGETATPFEHRSYGEELARCQRYYVAMGPQGKTDYVNEIGVGYCESSSVARGYVQFPTTMRSNPTVTSDQLEIRTITGFQRNINSPTFETNENGVYIDASNSGFTAGAGGLIRLENNAGKLEADAEL